MEVVHDQSSVMAREKWMWDAITSPDIAPVKFATPELEGSLPVGVKSTKFSDSTKCLQLQFADILAGASAIWARSSIDVAVKGDYVVDLAGAGIGEHLIGGIWPTPEVEAREMKLGSLGVSEYVDFIGDVLRQALLKRPPAS
jgi:hypothetical protein